MTARQFLKPAPKKDRASSAAAARSRTVRGETLSSALRQDTVVSTRRRLKFRWKPKVYDPVLFGLCMLATAIGLLVIFDAGFARSLQTHRGIVPREFLSQLVFLPLAVFLSLVTGSIRQEKWQKASKAIWLVTLALLVCVMIPGLRYAMNGAFRWIKIGPLIIQPAEFAKITAVLYVAGVFAVRKAWPRNIRPAKNFADYMDRIGVPKIGRILPAVWILASVVLIAKEPDLGTAAVIASCAFAIFAVGGATRKSLAAAVLISAMGLVVLVKEEPYRMDRIRNHFSRWSNENMDDTGYQSVQSQLAQASGGTTGVGIGAGRAKHVLPATTTDFIMATIGEEFGFLGSTMVLLVLGAIVARMLSLAQRAATPFAKYVLCGIAVWFGVQTCVNVMMANGVLPAIGIPLPFISSGGSSLIALWMAVGICQSMIAPTPKKEAASEAGNHRWGYRRPRFSGA